MRALAALLAIAILSGAGCTDTKESSERGFEECGLPAPEPKLKRSLVPPGLLLEGAQLQRVERERGGYIAAINTPHGVEEALGIYEPRVRKEGFEILTVDNEVFEAEIYLRRDKELGFIQIRRSQCDHASVVFINVIDQSRSGAPVPQPSTTGVAP